MMSQSKFKNSMPSDGIASASSNLVFCTFSIVLKLSMCMGPTEVIMPCLGWTISQISFISPTFLAPISQRKISCVARREPRTVLTTPKGVLKFPGVFKTLYLTLSRESRKYLTLVLPKLPVIPMTVRLGQEARILLASLM